MTASLYPGEKRGLSLALSLLLMVSLLLPSVAAGSKPITGTITLNNLPLVGQQVALLVSVVAPYGDTVCTADPSPTTGGDGSFSTNLDNLVVQGFPSLDCSSFWKAGDTIWYKLSYQGRTYSSDKAAIALGTGLQRLSPLNIIPGQDDDDGDDDGSRNPEEGSGGGSGGGGGSSGGSSGTGSDAVGNTLPSSDTVIIPLALSEYSLSLSLQGSPAGFLALITLQPEPTEELLLKLLVQSYPAYRIIFTDERPFQIPADPHNGFIIPAASFASGHYRAQVLLYRGEKLLGVSNIAEFFTNGTAAALPAASNERVVSNFAGQAIHIPGTGKSIPLPIFFLIGIIILALFLFIIIWRKRRGERPEPDFQQSLVTSPPEAFSSPKTP